MKKFLFLIPAFLLAFQTSKAQTEKGTQTLGANIVFHTQKTSNVAIDNNSGTTFTSDTRYTSLGVGPNYSYFIADKLDIGGSLAYTYINSNNGDNSSPSRTREHDFGGQVFLRKYFMYNDKLGLRAGPYLGYDRYNNKSFYNYPNAPIPSATTKGDNYTAGVNLGLVYYPAKSVGVSVSLASISYQHSKNSTVGNSGHASTDSFDASFISNNLGLSLFYVFGGK
jgi:long-subunit fatty acid transport protein